jgi:hypothetical protein
MQPQTTIMQLTQENHIAIDSPLHLRPRFELFSAEKIDDLKARFEKEKTDLSADYKINVVGNYIFLGIGLAKREYWSPNLQLELEEYEDGRTHIRGVFGPDPVLWTLFMFLHFVVAGIFLIFGVIAYSKYNLYEPYHFDLVVMFIMTNIWFLLYFIARYNRSRGVGQAKELEDLMRKILD